jgi:hypothetical protein
VLTNLHASHARRALAINAPPDATLPAYLRAMERLIAPRVVSSGPVKEVLKGDAVDLGALPQIVHHEGESIGDSKALADAQIGEDAREKILHGNATAMLAPLAPIAQREPAVA